MACVPSILTDRDSSPDHANLARMPASRRSRDCAVSFRRILLDDHASVKPFIGAKTALIPRDLKSPASIPSCVPGVRKPWSGYHYPRSAFAAPAMAAQAGRPATPFVGTVVRSQGARRVRHHMAPVRRHEQHLTMRAVIVPTNPHTSFDRLEVPC